MCWLKLIASNDANSAEKRSTRGPHYLNSRNKHLLVTAQRPALEFGDGEAKFPLQKSAGGACSVYFMVGQEIAVVFSPLHQILFLIVVRDQSDLLIMVHRNFFASYRTTLILVTSLNDEPYHKVHFVLSYMNVVESDISGIGRVK